MKYGLYMIMCSLIAGECMTPHKMEESYNSLYSCLNAGYKESYRKSEEIGKEEVNKHQIYLKFICKNEKEDFIVPKPKPKVVT
tara:strand:- start:217 stop:465 length:249 start_codon:yes stop_codon:yes gene_type:complete